MIVDIPKVGQVDFPDSMSEKEINVAAKKLFDDANVAEKPMSAQEVAGSAIRNLPSSTANLFSNLIDAISSPLQTGKAVLDVGAGALQNVLPEKLVQAIGEDRPSREVANTVGQFYADRYGSLEGAKKAVAEDPAGVLADLSTVFSGGSMIAPRAVAAPLAKIASTIDPLAIAARTTAKTANVLGGKVIAPILGQTTGAGRESIMQAYKAGEKGGDTAEQFRANISGRADQTDVLDIAKANLQQLNATKQAEYRSGMVNIKNDKSILDFGDIDKSIENSLNKVTYKGKIVNEGAAKNLEEAKLIINDWKSLDPVEFHTPEGLDALKKRVGDVLESIPFEQKVARSSIGDIYNSVKSTIQKQAPTYAKTMKSYSDATDQIREIERSLSLGKKASADTSMRKLQSLMRDNVQTNYGQRTKLGKELEAAGGQEFMPGLAGQALSNIMPRGLQGAASLPTGYLAYGVGGLPAAAITAATTSPRLMGEAAYGAGLASRVGRKFGEIVPPAADPRLYNALYQAGGIQGLLGQ
jgi:hypothetical protein